MITEKIQSLEQLLEVLPECSGTDYVELVKDMHISADELKPYAFWSEDFYTRNCIARTDDYELLLLCWEPGQTTPIHCHGGQECWVYLVQGLLEEIRYDLEENSNELSRQNKMRLKEEQFSYMNDDMGLHSLENISQRSAMSLHLYMNPIDECRIFDQETDTVSLKKIEYHSYKGKALIDGLSK